MSYIQETVNDALMYAAPRVPLSMGGGSDKQGRDDPMYYMDRPGEITGKIILASWKPTGHNVGLTRAMRSRNQIGYNTNICLQ